MKSVSWFHLFLFANITIMNYNKIVTTATKINEDDDDVHHHRQQQISKTMQQKQQPKYKSIDLKLSKVKTPYEMEKFMKDYTEHEYATCTEKDMAKKLHWSYTYALGSINEQQQEQDQQQRRVFSKQSLGLAECIQEAWVNHWNLRTSPDDWWFPIARRVALVISEASKMDRYSPEHSVQSEDDAQIVKDMFVSHIGKKLLSVSLPYHYIDEADYDDVFSSFMKGLEHSIKVPEFVQLMQNDFSSSTPAQRGASQINIMAGLKSFFEYRMEFCGCGLKSVEMIGTQEDWDKLNTKLDRLRQVLKPIQGQLAKEGLNDEWWDHVSYCFRNLAKTMEQQTRQTQTTNDNGASNATTTTKTTENGFSCSSGGTDDSICEFWANILLKTEDWSGDGPYGWGPRTHLVDSYDGWLIELLTGQKRVKLDDFWLHIGLDGVNRVPVHVAMTWSDPVVEDTVDMVAGIKGFTLHEDSANGIPTLQPYHFWAMMVDPKSKLLRESNEEDETEMTKFNEID